MQQVMVVHVCAVCVFPCVCVCVWMGRAACTWPACVEHQPPCEHGQSIHLCHDEEMQLVAGGYAGNVCHYRCLS